MTPTITAMIIYILSGFVRSSLAVVHFEQTRDLSRDVTRDGRYRDFIVKEKSHRTEKNEVIKPDKKSWRSGEEVPFYPFRNTSLSWNERAADIVDRLTLDELVSMTTSGGASYKPSPGIPRLGIGPYNFNTECLRGVVNTKGTAFPQAIGLAATFSTDVITRMAAATGREARALYIQAKAHGDYGDSRGISCFGPVSNLMRHPLWGRNQETYGEDPNVISQLTKAFVHGLHGNHERYLQANAGCKHLGLYSGPENLNGSRFSFATNVTERDLRLTYLPGFKACVESGAPNIMCSYTAINGVPSCANKRLLDDIVRKEYGFDGYYISDEGAIENMFHHLHYVNSTLQSAVASAKVGMNLELPPDWMTPAYPMLTEAVTKGLLPYQQLVENVKPMFVTRLRLGEFDPPEGNPYSSVPIQVVQSPEHQMLAVEAAIKSFILLKNLNNTLPLAGGLYRRLAIVGPMADNYEQLFGDYSPYPQAEFGSTPYAGLRGLGEETRLVGGCNDNKCQKYDNISVIAAVNTSDVVIICLGTGKQIEIEGTDRVDLLLPGQQLQLLKDAVTFAPVTSKIVLLVFTAGPVDISWGVGDPRVGAVIQCSFPAQAAGQALRAALAPGPSAGPRGEVTSPAGRLPYTWYYSLQQVPGIRDYSMKDRTYRYFQGEPLFPFGYGLSYTRFRYSNLTLSRASVTPGSDVSVSAIVHNIGNYTADEVVQVYISWENASVPMPNIQLTNFTRVSIPSGSFRNVSLVINAESFQVFSDTERFIYEKGRINLYVGGQQPYQTVTAPSNILKGFITIDV